MRNITFIGLVYSLISCAEKAPCEKEPMLHQSASSLLGLWHGFTLPFSLLGKIINLNIGIQEINYTGFQYWLGYLIGIVLLMKTAAFIATHKEKA